MDAQRHYVTQYNIAETYSAAEIPFDFKVRFPECTSCVHRYMVYFRLPVMCPISKATTHSGCILYLPYKRCS